MSGLRRLILEGIAWRFGVSVGQHGLQIVFTIVLARLLGAAEFGLAAMALLFVRFVQSISQIGFGAAIVQDQEATQEQVSAVFLLQLGINFAISLLCTFAAPLAAAFFGEPRLVPVVQVLAWGLFLNSLAFPQNLLAKEMRFRGFSLVELLSILVANLVAIVLAFRGHGVWALVARLMVQRLVFAAAVWVVAGWRVSRPRFAGVGRHFRFGLNLLGSNVCYYASQNLAAIILGKFAGMETLGCFTIAFNLAVVPAQKVQTVLAAVLMPAFARLQADLQAFRRAAYKWTFALGLVFIPLMFGLAATAQEFVLFAYGEEFRQAGVFLSFLAGVGLLKGLEHLLRCILVAGGRAGAIFRITFFETVASLPLLALGAQLGGTGLVAAYLAASVVSFALTVRAAQRSVRDESIVLRATARTLVASVVMGAAVAGFAALAPSPLVVTLLVQVLLGVALYLLLRLRTLTDEERALVRTWPGTGLLLR